MALLRVAPTADLAPGMRRRIAYPVGMKSAMVVVEADGIFAMENSCPHHGSSFDGGELTQTHVTCPWHFWKVDFRTGACLHNPAVRARTFEIVETDGVVYIDVPDELLAVTETMF
jgi:nitrite reductase/ring-hydroxylating ferredoxin subunit